MKITSIPEFKEELLDLMTKNPEKVFSKLRENLKTSSQHYKETILQETRYNRIKKEIRNGTSHMSDFDSSYNSILLAAINLINEIEVIDIRPNKIQNAGEIQEIEMLRKRNKLLEEQLDKIKKPKFDGAFLRRRDIGDFNIYNLLRDAKKEIIIKAICLTITKTGGLFYKFISTLEKKPDFRIKILLYDIFDSPAINIIERASLVSPKKMKEDINDVIKTIKSLPQELKERFDFALYDSFPTSSIILVDPEEDYGIGKFELYVYPFQPPEDKINVILKKSQDIEYFEEVHNSIKKELKNKIKL